MILHPGENTCSIGAREGRLKFPELHNPSALSTGIDRTGHRPKLFRLGGTNVVVYQRDLLFGSHV